MLACMLGKNRKELMTKLEKIIKMGLGEHAMVQQKSWQKNSSRAHLVLTSGTVRHIFFLENMEFSTEADDKGHDLKLLYWTCKKLCSTIHIIGIGLCLVHQFWQLEVVRSTALHIADGAVGQGKKGFWLEDEASWSPESCTKLFEVVYFHAPREVGFADRWNLCGGLF